MAGLREVVQGLARREGVRAVVVASGDGLPIDSAAADGLDAEAVAALVPTIARHAGQLGAAAHCGPLATGVLEYGDGFAVVAPLHQGNQLFLLLAPQADLGALLHDLRRHRPAIADLL